MPRFDCQIAQALNKLRRKTWGNSRHIVNSRPSTRVPFDDYIERLKDAVDDGEFFTCNPTVLSSNQPWTHHKTNQ